MNDQTQEVKEYLLAEHFYSIQGEGGNTGQAMIFIRFAGCKAKMACMAMGVSCDTNFETSSDPVPMTHILNVIKRYKSDHSITNGWVLWTGGEPLDQLDEDLIDEVKGLGFQQALETSGLHPIPKGIDYVTISPKVAEHVLAKNIEGHVHELRYVVHAGQSLPNPSLLADHYYLSPHSDGDRINADNLKYCIELCKSNPEFKLSVQNHKLWSVL